MATVSVRVPTALRTYSDGRAVVEIEVDADAPTVAAILDALARTYPGVVERVLDERGTLRRHVHVFVGEDDVRALGGLATPVSGGTELSILPAVSGGQRVGCRSWRSSPRLD